MNTLGGLLTYPIEQLPFVFLALVFALTLHEFAHAYTSDRFGDPTPRSMGRVTLNPRVHLDVLGTILIFIAGFGWAKPVLVNRSFYRYPRLMGVIVSVAGPLTNLVLGFLSMFCMYLFAYAGWFDLMSNGVFQAVLLFLRLMIHLNLILFLFNLLPIPPLDGYRIIQEFLPLRVQVKLQQIQQWVVYLFLLMFFIPPLYHATLGNLFSLVTPMPGRSAPIYDWLEGILKSIFE